MSYTKSAVVCLILTALSLVIYSNSIFIPLNLKAPVEIQIKKGMTFYETLEILYDKGLVRDKSILLLIGKIIGVDRSIKEGFYGFSDTISSYRVIHNIIDGRVIENTVTIPEGYNIWQIALRLEEAAIMSRNDFLSLAHKRTFLDELDIDAPSIEGFIFPDTYRFPKGMASEKVLKGMVANMRRYFTEETIVRAKEVGFSEREVLTLASIIEKEAKIDKERPLISAVFHNRLRKGMPLQADPTSIYGSKNISSRITYMDLKRKSPYNTYQIKGLPAGPIASPGLKSIMAALYPADVPYLFFVSQNNGRHHFSVTEAEHKKAIKRYSLGLRSEGD